MVSVSNLARLEDNDPRSLADKAYQLLVRKIFRLELAPGEPLVEKDLIAELNIGRTPIREALQRLANEGLVNHVPNRGMFVSEISATSVQHIYEFRALVDGHAARLAAMRATDTDIEELLAIPGLLEDAKSREDLDSYVDADRHYHAVLARAAQNTYLAEVIPRIFYMHLRLWFLIADKAGNWHHMAEAHIGMTREVSDAIAQRNPDEAELALRSYVSKRHRDIRELL